MMNPERLSRDKEHIRKFRYDALRTENHPKPDYRKIAERLLVDTPTQKFSEKLRNQDKTGTVPKYAAYKELDEIQQASRAILDLGHSVSVPTDVSCCACAHLYSLLVKLNFQSYIVSKFFNTISNKFSFLLSRSRYVNCRPLVRCNGLPFPSLQNRRLSKIDQRPHNCSLQRQIFSNLSRPTRTKVLLP